MLVPSAGRYLWDWYFALSDVVNRINDGVCGRIEPLQFIAWCQATQTIVRPSEYAILTAMDGAYRSEMNKELADARARDADRREQEAKQAPPGRKR